MKAKLRKKLYMSVFLLFFTIL